MYFLKKIKNNKTKSILLLLTLIFSTIFAFTTITLAGGPSQFEMLWGWDKQWGRWETGDLQGWMEGDYVNHRLEIDNFAGGNLTFHINLDYTWGSVIGLDKAVQFYVGDGQGNSNDPQNANIKYIGPIVDRNSPLGINESDTATTDYGTLTVTRLPNGPGKAGDSALRYEITVKTNLTHWFVYWESHLAIGSSKWHGSSLHVYTDEWGSKDVPIMVLPSPQGADLAITKSGPNYAHVGDIITYTYTVTNVGPASATGVKVTDDKAGTATYVSGDTNGNGKLDVGEAWIFTATYTVLETDPDPLTNTATVTSTTEDPNMANNQASWTVDILHPAIDVSKTADKSKAYAGDTITYTITVENTGDCTLYNVVVEDETLGISETIEELAVGASENFTASYTVKVGDPDPFVNTVTASGEDFLGMKVTADDSVEVDLVAKICGFKFHDKNANGVWDEGEEGVEGWTIELWLGETKLDETTTASDGSYCFDELDAGTYTVKEVPQSGWMSTTTESIVITLQSGEISEDNNFGNIKLGSISGYKFYDANANGVWDEGEVAIEGWKVHLIGGTVDSYAFTDEEGKFIFENLLPGTYTVEEVFPPPELNNGCMWINTTKPSFTHELEGGEDYVGPAFGNICLKPGTGGKTLGFWSNKNGQALITSDDVNALNELNLYTPPGWSYPKFSSDLATAKTQIKNYLLSATAKEMKWMLSAQLIATKLNVLHGFLNPNTIIYIDGKFISIGEIIENANTALNGTDKTEQAYWKNLLDGVNNNRFYFICDEPCYPITYP